MWFYIFALTVVILRCIGYGLVIKYFIDLDSTDERIMKSEDLISSYIDGIDNYATYFELILGVQ